MMTKDVRCRRKRKLKRDIQRRNSTPPWAWQMTIITSIRALDTLRSYKNMLEETEPT
jgi:hypothetical protein